jgi:hypothetical protein
MIGIVFITPNSKKSYRVISEHDLFKGVWHCYPADKDQPYKPGLIDCFTTEFIINNKNKNK